MKSVTGLSKTIINHVPQRIRIRSISHDWRSGAVEWRSERQITRRGTPKMGMKRPKEAFRTYRMGLLTPNDTLPDANPACQNPNDG